MNDMSSFIHSALLCARDLTNSLPYISDIFHFPGHLLALMGDSSALCPISVLRPSPQMFHDLHGSV